MFSLERDIVQLLFRLHQQVVEPVDLRRGVGQSPASLHHRVEVVAMVGVEREKQRHDRVPRVGPARAHQIAAHFTLGAGEWRRVDVHRLIIARRGRREGCGIEDTDVAGESRNHQVLVDGGDGPCRHRVPGVHQQFEPFAEAVLIEPFVAPWLGAGATDRGRTQTSAAQVSRAATSSPQASSPRYRMS